MSREDYEELTQLRAKCDRLERRVKNQTKTLRKANACISSLKGTVKAQNKMLKDAQK